MAVAALRTAFRCSICMDIYKNPVSLPCGHTFCRLCVIYALEAKEEQTGEFLCPECREDFGSWPHLLKNLPVKYVVANLLQEAPEHISFPCCYCIDSPVAAVQSCLLCEAHLCEKHVEVHSKSPEHVLCDPTNYTENRRCPIHNRLLEYYCTEDNDFFCVSCMLDGEHQGHQVETLDEAFMKKKMTLKNVVQILLVQKEETENRVQGLQVCRRTIEDQESSEMKRVMDLFRNLEKQQKKLKERVLREVSRLSVQASHRCYDVIQQLETKIDKLSKRLGHIEKLCDMTDPLTVLKESHIDNVCEEGDRQSHDGGHLDLSGISEMLHEGLSDIFSHMNVQEGLDIQASPYSSEEDNVPLNTEPSSSFPQETFGAGHSMYQPTRQSIEALWEDIEGNANVLLDMKTASNNLWISVDKKSVFLSHKNHKRSETPARFSGPQVISCQSFSSGRHIWEVDVWRSRTWRVGMCYSTIDRKNQGTSKIGSNEKSWALQKSNRRFSAIHNNVEIRLPDVRSIQRLKISLDYEAGQIALYNQTFPMRNIHTFHATFTEPLHAALSLFHASLHVL
ncbi:E3 ubiquitin/ISG15 ligase TRIM25-like [Hyperolius riggenbachi]|uniref:E3 ubiquitin/ISG15 ligase TRIM25-like n=1 Tax=Hyperolius riggenbachi TaxID=752182 RepID=UPI0035A3BE07